MKRISNFYKDKLYIEIVVATILFIIAIAMDRLMDFIIYMLYFIIFLEIVRTVINFIREQKVVLSILVDAFIILTLRELILNVVKVNKEDLTSFDALFSSPVNFNIMILSGVIVFLFFIRYLSIKTAPQTLLPESNEKKV
ncbi:MULTISPECIES: phosphate-starvation-inducible PsiE family protein [Malaciobacter]|jgi:uncharacterized membrane protein (DUF373 family)|uniref:Phosphate-starvation-inducible protein E n=2 Tax=Malaciobacter TaxID=2321114 RepID=A0AB36ZWC6_9BACT|nr:MULTISPECIES: phosphate-starvation-inducible PsiE family protein [Malaciobacter]PHO10410.1 hypothetical protein CPG37_04995 [Malaciobacter canalis]PPK61959.1 phosphate-starvation-inducible protein E [Malaciobacter marinus]QEE32515.1 putative membrane protein [Malaciobacter canalis]SKB25848.1 Phosphate-starvation-inducible E [Malaciobacter marinus]